MKCRVAFRRRCRLRSVYPVGGHLCFRRCALSTLLDTHNLASSNCLATNFAIRCACNPSQPPSRPPCQTTLPTLTSSLALFFSSAADIVGDGPGEHRGSTLLPFDIGAPRYNNGGCWQTASDHFVANKKGFYHFALETMLSSNQASSQFYIGFEKSTDGGSTFSQAISAIRIQTSLNDVNGHSVTATVLLEANDILRPVWRACTTTDYCSLRGGHFTGFMVTEVA